MYDYVIVGAGSAGCVLANRLTEDPDVSVLLLEAGGPDTNELVHLPAAFSALYRTAQDWDHSTIYEPFANDRRIYLPRGKVLGGSSSINAMVYMRGNPLDYDEWGPGWTWDEMLPYFKRSEDYESGESDFHGAGGPLPGSQGRSRNPLGQMFLDSATAHGLSLNEDFNGPEQDGVGWYQVTHRNGARASAAVAYLHPAMTRPNLTVETHVHALSILFEGERAVGVVGGRLHADPRRARRARRPVPFRAGALPVGGARAGRRPRLRAGRMRAEAEEPRVRGARVPRPDRETADRAQLPRASGRRGVDGGRRADLHGDLRERPAGRGVHGHADRPAVEVRRGHRGARARAAADALPPGRNLPDGRRPGCGRGPRAARARRQQAAGGGRVRDSFHPARQHQRPCDRAGGASRRPDQGRGAGGRADGAVTDAGLASSRG